MINATFTHPDLTTFARLDDLGLQAVGQHLTPDRAVIEYRLAEPDPWCHHCGAEATPRGTVTRWLAHEPFGHRPTTLLLRVRRFRCDDCARFWQEDTTRVVEPRGKLTRTALGWALRLLDMVQGRSKAVFKTWLAEQPKAWRRNIEVVAIDGFTWFKSAAAEEIPTTVAVMDPFHVIRLAGDALDTCRRRVQNDIFGRRGRKDDPLYTARRTLHTGASLLTDRQVARLEALFADEGHIEVEATYGIYQRMITAYREPDRGLGKFVMQHVINDVSTGVPAALIEVRTLGNTLSKRAEDILAYFDRPGTSNGPTEAINGRLEHLRGSALGFQNLRNYIARSLLEAGGFRPALHPRS